MVNEWVANRHFSDLDRLEKALVERRMVLTEQPKLVRGCTAYH